MNEKDEFIRQVTEAGDAVITYRSQNSRRLKYNVCTLDFDNKYIQSKGIAQNPHRDKFYCSVGIQIPIDSCSLKMSHLSFLSTRY